MTAEWEDCMIYRDFKDKKLSLLGFGAMRLPQNADGSVNEELVADMVKHAMDHGVNYYDTAYVYLGSEAALGEIFEKNEIRDQVYIATKLPHYLIKSVFYVYFVDKKAKLNYNYRSLIKDCDEDRRFRVELREKNLD